MAKQQKRWVYSPKRSTTSTKVPEAIKADVESKANNLIEAFLKPKHIQPPPEDERFNYLADITANWYRNYFYFCNRYNCPGPNAIRPYFDDKFARLEYVRVDTYNLSYMRHTGKWQPVYYSLTLDECLKAIQEDPLFHP